MKGVKDVKIKYLFCDVGSDMFIERKVVSCA